MNFITSQTFQLFILIELYNYCASVGALMSLSDSTTRFHNLVRWVIKCKHSFATTSFPSPQSTEFLSTTTRVLLQLMFVSRNRYSLLSCNLSWQAGSLIVGSSYISQLCVVNHVLMAESVWDRIAAPVFTGSLVVDVKQVSNNTNVFTREVK